MSYGINIERKRIDLIEPVAEIYIYVFDNSNDVIKFLDILKNISQTYNNQDFGRKFYISRLKGNKVMIAYLRTNHEKYIPYFLDYIGIK